MRARLWSGEVWVALGIVVLGAFLMFQTSAIEVSPNYARVGPRVFPWIVSSVLVLLGIVLLRSALVGRWTSDEAATQEGAAVHGAALVWLVLALAVYLIAIKPFGFPIAAALLFVGTARAFGSARSAVDLGIGLVLGVVVFAGFNYGLGLSLPAGILIGVL